MHLAYLDDSGGSDKNAPIVTVGILMIPHQYFTRLEAIAGFAIGNLLPPERLESFERFHAFELFGGTGNFAGIDRDLRHRTMRFLLEQIKIGKFPFVYSAVDRQELKGGLLGSANPVDLAFRMCLYKVEHILLKEKDTEDGIALLICDDCDDSKVKKEMRQSFRILRPKVAPPIWLSGALKRIHDDIYFGSSRDSIGLQMSDLCTWVMNRRFMGSPDADQFFEIVKDQVVCADIEPTFSQNRDLFFHHKNNEEKK
ncbi:MAG: hypothetical protein JWO20_1483 [Candidatus Angelobacter sp.]|nr:hypothetical protein [Candidatus Angelobacter sp.]